MGACCTASRLHSLLGSYLERTISTACGAPQSERHESCTDMCHWDCALPSLPTFCRPTVRIHEKVLCTRRYCDCLLWVPPVVPRTPLLQRFQRCAYKRVHVRKVEGRGWGMIAAEDIDGVWEPVGDRCTHAREKSSGFPGCLSPGGRGEPRGLPAQRLLPLPALLPLVPTAIFPSELPLAPTANHPCLLPLIPICSPSCSAASSLNCSRPSNSAASAPHCSPSCSAAPVPD